MRDSFALLLDGFSALAARSDAADASLTARIRTLLNQFGECRDRAERLEQARAAAARECICALLIAYSEAVDRYCRQQEQVADDFNLLDVMRLTGKEIRHSMVLAWLLDHDLRKLGTHAQETLVFGCSLASSAISGFRSTMPPASTG
jgi:hypothetical protein